MPKQTAFSSKQELQKAILREKAKGTPDFEIGQKYGVTYRYIERLITKSQGVNISALHVSKRVRSLAPRDFHEEGTTVWSFKQRGNWATHSGEYRGNWSPYIPRNVILKYSKPGDLVLDYFCGAGTTAVESKLLGRRCIALDINGKAIELAKKNTNFLIPLQQTFDSEKAPSEIYEPKLLVGDARDLSFLEENSVDLICAHPPYADIIHYTDSKKGDLSLLGEDEFLKEMSKVARESLRVLKPGKQCAILIGDMRSKKHVIPLGFRLINVYLDAGFRLRELVIKRQHNCKTTGFWYASSVKYNFLLLAHEYLPIFEKPVRHYIPVAKETAMDYRLVIPTLVRPRTKRKLGELETTTVWILPENDFEKRLHSNLVDRYGGGSKHLTVSFSPGKSKPEPTARHPRNSSLNLLFIKAPFLGNDLFANGASSWLEAIREVIGENLAKFKRGGFIVIQTQDARVSGSIQPAAKLVVDEIANSRLWLKEIVVATQDKAGAKPIASPLDPHLQIAHQYLIVYEVIK